MLQYNFWILDLHSPTTKQFIQSVWVQGDLSICRDLWYICFPHNQCTCEIVLAGRLATTGMLTGGPWQRQCERPVWSPACKVKCAKWRKTVPKREGSGGYLALHWSTFSSDRTSTLLIICWLICNWCFYFSFFCLIFCTIFYTINIGSLNLSVIIIKNFKTHRKFKTRCQWPDTRSRKKAVVPRDMRRERDMRRQNIWWWSRAGNKGGPTETTKLPLFLFFFFLHAFWFW